jgi:hypothetical protein
MAGDPPCLFVALGLACYWHAADGPRLDTRPFVRAVEFATGWQAVVLGKPMPAFCAVALERIGQASEQVLMVGDEIRSDVGGTRDAGIEGLLVRTGKYRDEDLGDAVMPRTALDAIADPARWREGQDAHDALPLRCDGMLPQACQGRLHLDPGPRRGRGSRQAPQGHLHGHLSGQRGRQLSQVTRRCPRFQ